MTIPSRVTRILTLALTATIAAGAGSAAAALRAPEHGPAGPPGIAGPAGSAGPAGAGGAQGAAAQTGDLGVCVSTKFSGTTSYVDGVYSLSRRANGATYCAYGTPTDVTPQPDTHSTD